MAFIIGLTSIAHVFHSVVVSGCEAVSGLEASSAGLSAGLSAVSAGSSAVSASAPHGFPSGLKPLAMQLSSQASPL